MSTTTTTPWLWQKCRKSLIDRAYPSIFLAAFLALCQCPKATLATPINSVSDVTRKKEAHNNRREKAKCCPSWFASCRTKSCRLVADGVAQEGGEPKGFQFAINPSSCHREQRVTIPFLGWGRNKGDNHSLLPYLGCVGCRWWMDRRKDPSCCFLLLVVGHQDLLLVFGLVGLGCKRGATLAHIFGWKKSTSVTVATRTRT